MAPSSSSSSFTSKAKKYSGNSTFQSTAVVVFIGIVLLIWMLTSESNSDQHYHITSSSNLAAKKATLSPEERQKIIARRKAQNQIAAKDDNKNKKKHGDQKTVETSQQEDEDHVNPVDEDDAEFYRKQREADEAKIRDQDQEDDPFHINHDENPRHHQTADSQDNHHNGDEDVKHDVTSSQKKIQDVDDGAQSPEERFNAAKIRNQKNRVYLFELDKPRAADEETFFHLPKSAGGVLVHPSKNPKFSGDFEKTWDHDTKRLALDLYYMFSAYDQDETAPRGLHFYGTMCVGLDCNYIQIMIHHLNVSIGHFIVVVNTEEQLWKERYGLMQELYPGRFTSFYRPQKLSCAESWNLVTRTAMTQRPQPDQVFISNADWHPIPTPDVENNLARFAEWSRTKLHLVVSRYFHFSSFVFTQTGYRELGYFDEVIYPALAEDVEAHVKAVSKGMGELGLYDKWSEGSKHITRASAGDRKISQRNDRVARFDYILRKWNVRVPNYRDFAHSKPYANPWNNPKIMHNNSWAVDPEHRKCANTGQGKLMTSGRCYYNVSVLQQVMPPGETFVPFSEVLTTTHDSFPGGYH